MEIFIKVVLVCWLLSMSIVTFKHAHISTGGVSGLNH